MNDQQKKGLGPTHSHPVDRLKLEIVCLKGGVVGSGGGGTLGTATACLCATLTVGTVGSFADEE